jgi:pimeloyl-ACP methyl ester carboxylesterase
MTRERHNVLKGRVPSVDGTVLRGNVYGAAQPDAPAVVMSAGMTPLKEHHLEGVAEAFQRASISALVYDHRSFRSSDGTPRHHTDPRQHAEDYHDAVSAVMNFSGVDRPRIAMRGVGHSAGWVMMAAGDDPRIKAAVVARPIYSGLLERAWQDRQRKTQSIDSEPTYVKVWPDSVDNAAGDGAQPLIPGEMADNLITGGFAMSDAAGTPWENMMTLYSAYLVASVEANRDVEKIKVPTLWVAAADDPFAEPVDELRRSCERIVSNAEFAVIDRAVGGSAGIDVQLDFCREFFERQLKLNLASRAGRPTDADRRAWLRQPRPTRLEDR